MALHDLLGKAAGLPLYKILGGTNRPLITCLTIPIAEPAAMAQRAKSIADQGFTIIKLKLGAGVAGDIARVTAVRQAVGPDIILRVDANQGWDVPAALAVLRAIERLNVEYCEQPVPYWNHAALKSVADKSPIPIVADETVFDHHDALKTVILDAGDYINIKLAKAGGIRNAAKIAAIADAAGKACMIGCMMESRLGLTAGAQFALSQKHIRYVDLDAALLLAADPIQGGMRYEGQQVILPETPGLGVQVDPAFLATLGRQTI
jgi:L-alanine-DL-glutamate epimerase-like enolase superfamily enzyme